MTGPIAPTDARSSWVDRMPSWLRLLLLLASATAALTAFTFALGFAIGYAEEADGIGWRGAMIFTASLLVTALLGWFAWHLFAPWRSPTRSRFERRYTRMWVILFALGLPVGMLLGWVGESGAGDLFSTGPIAPNLALLAAAAVTLVGAFVLTFYHRTIDAHEEHAYLWANTGAIYFLVLALPAAWLLDRGGLIGPLGFGSAMLLLLASCVVQCAVWAWLKYR